VKLVKEKVESYGKIENTNDKVESSTKPDMYRELKKLKELLDTGIITQAEFDKKKKEILNR
jgi:predicted Zn-dependent peptidase